MKIDLEKLDAFAPYGATTIAIKQAEEGALFLCASLGSVPLARSVAQALGRTDITIHDAMTCFADSARLLKGKEYSEIVLDPAIVLEPGKWSNIDSSSASYESSEDERNWAAALQHSRKHSA